MTLRLLRAGVFVLCLAPMAWLLYGAGSSSLGPDPAEVIMHVTGEWSLRCLILVLFLPLLRRWTGWSGWSRLSRMLGLYAFFYGCVHLASFGHFFIGWTPAILLEELAERPYITLGFAAWALMLPLALTSTRGMQRRLRKNWKRLHRLVYPAALLACAHLVWQARADVGEALVYLVLVLALLAWRIRHRAGPREPAAA